MLYGLLGLVVAILIISALIKSVAFGGIGGIILLVVVVMLLTGRL